MKDILKLSGPALTDLTAHSERVQRGEGRVARWGIMAHYNDGSKAWIIDPGSGEHSEAAAWSRVVSRFIINGGAVRHHYYYLLNQYSLCKEGE